MDSYYQALGEASTAHQSVKEQIASLNQQATEKADLKKQALQAFGEPLLAHGLQEGLVDLTKNTSKKVANELEKRGVIPKGTTENIGKTLEDFKEGGLRRVINTQVSPRLQGALETAQNKVSSLASGFSSDLPDIQSLQGFRGSQAVEKALKPTFEPPKIPENLSQLLRPVQEEDPFSQPKKLFSSVESITAKTVKSGENAETVGKDILKGAKKTAEIATETGGEEGNILGDVVALGTGLGTSLGGIFGGHHKEQTIDQANILNPSLQLGAY